METYENESLLQDFEVVDKKEYMENDLSMKYPLKYPLIPIEDHPNTSSVFWKKRTRIKWNLMLFFGCMLLYSSRTSLSICVSQMSKEYGWDKRISGFVLSSFFFGYILTQVLGGILSDRYGGERMLFLSASVWSICTFCLPLLGHLPLIPVTGQIIVMQVITGAAQGIHFPALTSLLCKRVKAENRNTSYSLAASGTSVGNIFCGIAGTLLLQSHGWRSVFFTTGGLSIAWVILIKCFINSTEQTEGVEVAAFTKNNHNSLKDLARHAPFWALLFCGTCESLVFVNLLSWLPTYFHDEFPESEGLLFNVLPWVASVIITNIAGMLSDHMISRGCSVTRTRKLFVSVALLAPAFLSIVLNFVSNFNVALFLMTSIIGFMGCNSSGIGVNPQDLSLKNAGYIYGVMNSMGALSGTLGVSFTGYILHSTTHWASVFYMTSVVSFLGIFSFVLFGSGDKID